MIASIKIELWYLDSAEMTRLEKDEPLKGLGALVHLLAYLRRQHNAIGSKSTLDKVALVCACKVEWLWHIITDYSLFSVTADESFYSPYQRQTLGMTAHPGDGPSRIRRRRRAPYSEDSNNSKDRETRKTASDCVCLNDTRLTPEDEEPAREQTDYRNYNKYLKR